MWTEAIWTCLQNILQLFETMWYQFFRKESRLFTPKNTFLEGILVTSLANNENDSLDGESFVSQSRFDAYAIELHVFFFISKKFIRKWGSCRQNLKRIVRKSQGSISKIKCF